MPNWEPADFSELYNTPLNDHEEKSFQQWASDNKKLNDLRDYDLRGFWKDGGQFADNGHGSDTYKKPNHPTFSTGSKYHGVDDMQGGTWDADQFHASETNLGMNPLDKLQGYFNKVEPETQLEVPNRFATLKNILKKQ